MTPRSVASRGWLGTSGTQPKAVASRGWLTDLEIPANRFPCFSGGTAPARDRRHLEDNEILVILQGFMTYA